MVTQPQIQSIIWKIWKKRTHQIEHGILELF